MRWRGWNILCSATFNVASLRALLDFFDDHDLEGEFCVCVFVGGN